MNINKDRIIKTNVLSSRWCAYPDDQMLKAFNGFLNRWPKCPICDGKYGFVDYSGAPIKMDKDFGITCLSTIPNSHFSATIKHKVNYYKNNKYIKKIANFNIRFENYSVAWRSTIPNKVNIEFKINLLETKTLLLKFDSLDKWFVPEKQLKENLDRLKILL